MRTFIVRLAFFQLLGIWIIWGCSKDSLKISGEECAAVRVIEVDDTCMEDIDLSPNPCLDLCLVLNRLGAPITQGAVSVKCPTEDGNEACDPTTCPYCGDTQCLESELRGCPQMPNDDMRADCVCCIVYRTKYVTDFDPTLTQECLSELCKLSPENSFCQP